ncbi:MAG: 50S ribosomal protein L25/general stress protein Ctc [Thermoleophilaceae bacterium]
MATQRRPNLKVEERAELGSRAVRRLRRSGYVPGVVYGGDSGGARSFKVGTRDLRLALASSSQVIDLEVGGGGAVPVILKDQQRHPVRDEVMHVDMLEVDLREKIHSTVTVDLEGADDAPGAKEGGVLEQVTRELNIEALPTNLPERIVVDVSGMEAAATMTLAEVSPPDGVEFLDDPEETIIATITVPTQVEEPEIEQETELVGEAESTESGESEAQAEGATGGEAESGAGPGGQDS